VSTPISPRSHSISDANKRQPQRFGPRIHEVARYMASQIEPAHLEEIDKLFPGLSVHDLVGATALVQALRMDVEGNA
jgi:hypothetical protein